MEDGSGSRVDVMPTPSAGPRLALLRSLILFEWGLVVTLRAVSLVVVNRIASVPEPVKTSVIVGEVGHELHE